MQIKKLTAILLAATILFFSLPAAVSAEDSGKNRIKNVIFMIGDGMGENHLELAKQEGYTLFMEDNCDLRGQSKTRSTSEVTDSAAGATALSCGIRTDNKCLCVYADDHTGAVSYPTIITEVAIRRGMKTAIVTTDKTSGATPAGFSVHVKKRSLAAEITEKQLASDIDFIWGAKESEASREDVEAAGFKYITDKDAMNALAPGERSFAQFDGITWPTETDPKDNVPTLAEMTVKALELLDADNENGFYIMIEGAHIDKNSHRDSEGPDYPRKVADTANAVKGFDNAIKAAVEFARADGHTLVVVTADHETGDLYFDNGRYTFHSGSHTAANVPVLVYGCDDLFAQGEAVDNMSIPIRIAAKLGWSDTDFPERNYSPIRDMILPYLTKLIASIQRILRVIGIGAKVGV
ncbi:MAG: alkaline phosphatase [Clostridia bacterium]|nr:alkaline phosphatase [Clostridia bacterium]